MYEFSRPSYQKPQELPWGAWTHDSSRYKSSSLLSSRAYTQVSITQHLFMVYFHGSFSVLAHPVLASWRAFFLYSFYFKIIFSVLLLEAFPALFSTLFTHRSVR